MATDTQNPNASSAKPPRRTTDMTNPTRASQTTRRALALRRRQGAPHRRFSEMVRDLLTTAIQRASVQLLVDGVRDLWAWIADIDWEGMREAVTTVLASLF